MHINDIENIMNYLFSAALKKCGNFEDAEDLTSETLLAALNFRMRYRILKSGCRVYLTTSITIC